MFPVISNRVAVYVFKQSEERIYFLQLRRSAADDIYGYAWHPVYGGAEAGEMAADTARRELFEETGLKPGRLLQIEYLESFYFRARNTVEIMPVFAAEVSNNADVILNDEHADFRWIGADEVNTYFGWRTQRDALKVILETLQQPEEQLSMLLI